MKDTNQAYWCVVFIDHESGKGKLIKNNRIELQNFYNSYKDSIFVGFNSRSYDQYIFKGILLGLDPGYINDQLILNNKKGFEVVREAFKIPLNNFDIMPSPPVSLKTLEGFMGSNIKESSVPFDIDRELTDEEERELISYNIHDVKETMKVFNARREEFDSQLQLIEAFDLDMTMFSKTKAQLSAHILGAKKHKDRGDEFKYNLPLEILKIDKYTEVVEWYFKDENKDYKKKLELDIFGVPHVFAFGGIHGAVPNYKTEGIILCCDVSSLYPAIMINFNTLSRNVANPEKYTQIRDERLKLKAEKNPKQQPLKIVLNSTFGASKDRYNPLFDAQQANNTCLSGQLLLLDLIEKVAPYCEIIQSNTDGLFMKVDNEEDVIKIKKVAKEWEIRTNFELEWERYDKIYQKDVNNYIIIDTKTGKYSSKGAYVKKLNDLDYDLPIINKAMVNYFVNDIPIEDTINKCNELREFQKIIKLTSAYQYAYKNCTFSKKKVLNEETGRMRTVTAWNEDGDILYDKTFRVFASNRENDGGIFKKKVDKNPEKFANTPEYCFIDNNHILGKKIPDYLDKQYYIDLAQTRINQFLGISNRKKAKKKDNVN
ncbi:hypothetical protein M3572_03270 [Lederbergia lenta]|nr:hypothetical protein [Lederbergia lenta]